MRVEAEPDGDDSRASTERVPGGARSAPAQPVSQRARLLGGAIVGVGPRPPVEHVRQVLERLVPLPARGVVPRDLEAEDGRTGKRFQDPLDLLLGLVPALEFRIASQKYGGGSTAQSTNWMNPQPPTT